MHTRKLDSAHLQEIQTEALDLGFCQLGVVVADTSPFFPQFKQWLDRGHYGDMQFFANLESIRKRQDPSLLLPGCCSVITLALPYPALENSSINSGRSGKIASYATLPDYHRMN